MKSVSFRFFDALWARSLSPRIFGKILRERFDLWGFYKGIQCSYSQVLVQDPPVSEKWTCFKK